ncbi:MAG: hypothetical protein A3J94_13010 [Syntrophus sp. RIFOXYC2_FULL_54_9]|nr:MAG: hypothetical protein A3J94_13010 [Syntrophus sp. RIFOXYC2_FULL_54_9]
MILAFFPVLTPFSLVSESALFAAVGSDKADARPMWEEGIAYLFSMLKNKDSSFDVQKVSGLLDFVVSEKGGVTNLDPGKRENATGAYFYSDVKAPLSKVIKYAYNPKIPAYLTLPSVIRLGGWQVKPDGPVANLWEKVSDVKVPLVMRGVEYEEITPDMTTGAYYRYDMDRLMVLLKYRGKVFFISATRQMNPSTVGRQGVIIGPDTDWNYFYSGQKGLNQAGLGWVSSYMYDASSVSILFEPGVSKTQTRFATFKWLRAGWGGINMVRRENIIEGGKRFASGFKKVLESPQLPGAERLIDVYAGIKTLSDQDLSARLQPIGKALQKLSRTDPGLSRSDFRELIESGKYLRGMSREEQENLLMSEYMKFAIGKPSFLDRSPL